MSDLKTPAEWAADEGMSILDPTGWTEPGAPSLDTPIGYDEYRNRVLVSVVGPIPQEVFL